MTFVPVGTGIATAAAAQHAETMRNEEETMTPYMPDDTDGWEFKIVRSGTAKFRRPEVVRRLVDEEARAGWELLEKFDDYRIRFKRRVEHRADDAHRQIDPYRTQIGLSTDQFGMITAGVVLVLLAIGGLVAFWLTS
jgi:hypothetical protein